MRLWGSRAGRIVAAVGVLVAGLGGTEARAVPAAAACDTTPTGGFVTRSPYTTALDDQTAGGTYARTYQLHVPEDLPDGPVPLLVSIHGLAGNGVQQSNQIDWDGYFASVGERVIIVHPNGPLRWDTRPASEDVAFIRDVVADLRTDRCIDAARVYATGHSYGAMMVQRLACDAGDLFAAGAAYAGGDIAGSVVGGPCNAGTDTDGDIGLPASPAGYLPVPLGLWHGTADSIVSYEDGLRTRAKWLHRYDCDTVPVETTQAGSGLETGGIASGAVHGRCARPDVDALGRPALLFQDLPGHDHAWPNGCVGTGGAGGAGVAGCTPDGTYPSTYGFNGVVWSWLSGWTRSSPAAVQEIDGPVPPVETSGPDPGFTTGADNISRATVEPTADPVGSVLLVDPSEDGRIRVGVRLDVTTNGNAQGLGSLHPACPQPADGSTVQPAVGKRLIVTLGDATGHVSSTEVVTEAAPGGRAAVAAVALPVPSGTTGPLAVRVLYPGDPSSLWHLCGLPFTFGKQTIQIAAAPVVPEVAQPALLALAAAVLVAGALRTGRRRIPG